MLLLALGLLTRLAFLSQPGEVVWDEGFFGAFAQCCFTHAFFFDIHPPLGKLIIALGAYLGGFDQYLTVSLPFFFLRIGEPYGAMPFPWFRLFPALAGALIPLAVYFFLKQLRINDGSALFGATLLVFDNALLTQSRLILIDSFVILFGFLGLGCFLAARGQRYRLSFLLPAGVLLGASVACKWTGLGYLALALLVAVLDLYPSLKEPWLNQWSKTTFAPNCKQRPKVVLLRMAVRNKSMTKAQPAMAQFTGELSHASVGCARYAARITFNLIFVPLIVYACSFSILFRLTPYTSHDSAFVSRRFQSQPFWNKFFELNTKMYTCNAGLAKPHQDSSPAYLWPLMYKPVFYWQKIAQSTGADNSYIYLVGNPVLWYSGLIGMVLFMLLWERIALPSRTKYLLTAGYLVNFAPFLLVHRVLFLYHYLSALIFSVVFFTLVLGAITSHCTLSRKRFIHAGLMLAVIVGFLFYAPLSYGFPIKQSVFHAQMGWLLR